MHKNSQVNKAEIFRCASLLGSWQFTQDKLNLEQREVTKFCRIAITFQRNNESDHASATGKKNGNSQKKNKTNKNKQKQNLFQLILKNQLLLLQS